MVRWGALALVHFTWNDPKESLLVTIPYTTRIINTSIITKALPESWKCSIIILIHKSSDIEEYTNFRLIHFLPILSKIL